MNIIQKSSPNFGSRNGFKPEFLVIHIMAGSLVGTDSWFANPASQVSAHYGVGTNGEIHQYVQENSAAWHAGRVDAPTWNLIKPNVNPNLYTIGIEHEGTDLSKASVSELEASAELIKSICTRWNIPIDRDHIVGHYQIFAGKPNCPATDKSVIDRVIAMANPQKTVDKTLIKKQITDLLAQL